MSNTIEIEVLLAGAEQAVKQLKGIESLGNSLDKKQWGKAYRQGLRLANSEITNLRRGMDSLSNKKVQLSVDYHQLERANREAQAVYKSINRAMRNGKISQLTASQLKDSVTANYSDWFNKKWGTNLTGVYAQDADALNAKFRELGLPIKQAQQATRELKTELSALRNVNATPRFDFEAVQRRWTSLITQMGSRITSLGGALSSITAPIDQLLRGTLYSTAYMGLGKITEGFSRSFTRYDVMSTYPKIMKSLGYSAEEASKAVNELDQSVLGLPTSLDDIVSAQKVFVLASGDMAKATKLAIAANNAFVGGGANEEQRMYGMRQLQDLLSAGKLRSQEWYSLFKSMPAAIQAVGKELGYTGNKTKEFQSALMEGTVSTDQFLDGLIKVGNKGGIIYDLAQQMKSTWSAVSANISIAFARMGQHVLETLDTVFEASTGKNFLQNVMGLRDYIDNMAESVNRWVAANPDKIMSFFNSIKQIDAVEIVKGMAQAIGNVSGVILKLAKIIDGHGATFGKILIYTNLLGKALKIAGLSIKGTAGGWGKLIATFAGIQEGSKALKIPLVAKLKTFFSKFKGAASAAEAAGTAATGATAATASIGTLLTGLVSVITPALVIGAYAGAFAIVGKAIESFGNSMKSIGKMNINWNRVFSNLLPMAGAVAGIATFAAAIGAIHVATGGLSAVLMGAGGASIAGIALLAENVASAMNALANAKIPSTARFGDLKDALSKIGDLYAELDTGSFWKSLSRKWRSGNDNKYLKNIESMSQTISEILDNVYNAISQIQKISAVHGISKDIERTNKIVPKITEFISGIYNLTSSLISGGFGDKEVGNYGNTKSKTINDATKDFEKLSSYIAAVDSALTGIEGIPKHINTIHEKLKEVKSNASAGGKGKLEVDSIVADMKNVVEIVKAIASDSGLASLAEPLKKLKDVDIAGLEAQLDKIPELLGKLQDLRNYFEGNGTKWLTPTGSKTKFSGFNKFGNIGQRTTTNTYDGKAGDMLESIRRIVGFIKDISTEINKAPDMSDKATTLQSGITAVYNALKRFIGMSNYIKKNPIETDAVKTGIKNIITDVGGALQDVPSLMLYASMFKTAMKDIKTALDSVTSGKGSINTFLNGLKKIPAQLQKVSAAMKGKGAAWKKQLTEGFKGTASYIIQRVQNIATALQQSGLTSSFYSAGTAAGQAYYNGFNNAVVGVGNAFNQITNGVLSALPFSTGGMASRNGVLYRAGGGSIFKPRGTDVIPAMLSEGEYVMRRKAVRGFGAKFMQKINNLDLMGAIESLGMRGGQLAFATPSITIDNSSHVVYNNNQSVSMTNNHASQGYSEARASRWMRSLK